MGNLTNEVCAFWRNGEAAIELKVYQTDSNEIAEHCKFSIRGICLLADLRGRHLIKINLL